MKNRIFIIAAAAAALAGGAESFAQTSQSAVVEGNEGTAEARTWTLQECIDYAIENNISLRQSRNTLLSGLEDTYQAKSAMLPSLSGSVSQGITNRPFSQNGNSTVIGSDVYSTSKSTSWSGNYGLNAGMTLYGGGSLRTSLKQSRLQNSIDSLSVEESTNDIVISIVQAYMQCLYASEAVKVGESTAEAAKAQLERAKELKNAGELSKVDVAQLESQYASDLYQVTAAKTNLDNYKLQLKQLLELGVSDEIVLEEPTDDESGVLRLLPSKEEVYAAALEAMPDVRKAEMNETAAELSVRQAKSAYSPTLSANASVGTTNVTGTGNSFGDQLEKNFNESIGLSLQVPIFQNRKAKSAVNKAKIEQENSRLERLSAEKNLLKEIENTYLEAVSAQSKYLSAKEQARYAEESYNLTAEQFSVGMKNTVELITAQNTLLDAQVQLLQSKYTALMDNAILDIYQGNYKIYKYEK
jgi:outer membrane protein